MKPVTSDTFGFLIAYLIPGCTVLWGMTYVFAPLHTWIGGSSSAAPTVGGFLYTTVAAVAAGVTASTVRWLVLDTLHHRTGLRPPAWDFSLLDQRVSAYAMLIEIHYHHYLFHGNMEIALLWAWAVRRWALGFWTTPLTWVDGLVLLLAVLFFLGSRDNLKKYYTRTGQLLDVERLRQREREQAAAALSRFTSGSRTSSPRPR